MIRCVNDHRYEIKPKRASKEECPFCWVQRQRIKKFDFHKIKLTHEEQLYNRYPSMIDEWEHLKTIVVPAGFADEVPDTPESVAAKQQENEISGVFYPEEPDGKSS